MVDRVLGKAVKHSTKAFDIIADLARKGDPDSVKLSAAKALLEQLVAIDSHVRSERRIAQLIEQISRLEAALENKSSDPRPAE